MSKNIVICCDGTGQEFGVNNTNVVELYAVSAKSPQQLTFYDPGVGTGGWEYHDEEGASLEAKADQATGRGLQNNVNDAYRILMDTYEADDHVYLFGFSRGAFTVRSLTGMLYKVGLLDRTNNNLVEYAAEIYNRHDNDNIASQFRETFGQACPVHCLGVWDTVDSLVLNAKERFHAPKITPETTYAYQALSIDEQRKDFPPSIWDESKVRGDQKIEQVWFSGVHSDIGGGYAERGLANCALLWMLDRAQNAGLKINQQSAIDRHQPDPLDTLHHSNSGIWVIRGTHVREVPQGSRIHKSAADRMNANSTDYCPRNLPDRESLEIIQDSLSCGSKGSECLIG